MTRKLLPALAFLLLPTLMHAEARMLRHPTYSKGKIAFSYLGDIWIVNEDGKNPDRLKINKARNMLPRFSPVQPMICVGRPRSRLLRSRRVAHVLSATTGRRRSRSQNSTWPWR